jgi:hypothetical protein
LVRLLFFSTGASSRAKTEEDALETPEGPPAAFTKEGPLEKPVFTKEGATLEAGGEVGAGVAPALANRIGPPA